MKRTDYIKINRKLWNDKVPYHLKSAMYNLAGFKKGKSSLNKIEKSQLGDIKGKKILHLQCHFGMGSLSLARLGAIVTGVDFSDKAINTAMNLSRELKLKADFICSDIYNLKKHLHKKFDMVFSSYGTIYWLPDLAKWAGIISHFLKKRGEFHFVEFHPFIFMLDDDFKNIFYDYFNNGEIIEEVRGTYADRNAPIKNLSVSWNHSMGEILSALIKSGLSIKSFKEYDYSPYDCFNNMVKTKKGNYMIKGLEKKIPLLFSIKAVKKYF